ncbi:hypothetical protein GCM10009835_02760 [Planosporangium flavigriseum]
MVRAAERVAAEGAVTPTDRAANAPEGTLTAAAANPVVANIEIAVTRVGRRRSDGMLNLLVKGLMGRDEFLVELAVELNPQAGRANLDTGLCAVIEASEWQP